MHWTLKARPTSPAACFWPPCMLPLPTRSLALVSKSSVQSIRPSGPAARASARRRAGKAGPASCGGSLTAQAGQARLRKEDRIAPAPPACPCTPASKERPLRAELSKTDTRDEPPGKGTKQDATRAPGRSRSLKVQCIRHRPPRSPSGEAAPEFSLLNSRAAGLGAAPNQTPLRYIASTGKPRPAARVRLTCPGSRKRLGG